jgi:hypothetical protein
LATGQTSTAASSRSAIWAARISSHDGTRRPGTGLPALLPALRRRGEPRLSRGPRCLGQGVRDALGLATPKLTLRRPGGASPCQAPSLQPHIQVGPQSNSYPSRRPKGNWGER